MLAQRLDTASSHHRAPAQNNRSTAVSLAARVPAKAGPATNPMPTLRFNSFGPLLLTLAPMILFADVPGINLDHQREGLPAQGHALAAAFACAHGFIQLLALAFGPLASAPRFAIQRRWRQSFTPVKCSSTALASATGILLASNAAISCTEGEALPVSSKPKASSAGKRHALHRRHQPRLRPTLTGPNRLG